MNIDVSKLNEEFMFSKFITKDGKEFAKQVMDFQEMSRNAMQIEIEGVIKKYAQIEAERVIELYNKYINKPEVS